MSDLDDELFTALDEAELLAQITRHYVATESYQGQLKSAYQRLYHYYNPLNGDQWPEDAIQRPGKIHMTLNIIKPAVDVDARIKSIMPRLALLATSADDDEMRRAEAAEALFIEWLELSGWDLWFPLFNQCASLYGKGVLKPFWNKDDDRPDVSVVENPANLRIGWGSSDYNIKDWALYEYAISPEEAMRRWPDLMISNPNKGSSKPLSVVKIGDHTDPLNQKFPVSGGNASDIRSRPVPYQPSDYEDKQVVVWDYWYKKRTEKGVVVCNVVVAGKQCIVFQKEHGELPDIPYIVAENDHALGNPEGVSTVEPIIDLQIEMNRALSHWAQLVADEIDPAWQLNADSVPGGMVPKGGEIVAAGEGKTIQAIPKGVNQFPLAELVGTFWQSFHKETGLPEILFGQTPSADISGRALAVQVEGAINRLDFRRRRAYGALRELLVFWGHMTEKVDPKIEVQEAGEKKTASVAELIQGFRRWKIVPPEITPRDLIEATTNTLNKVSGKAMSLRTAMDELGIDAPEKELDRIRSERNDAGIFPGDVQAKMGVVMQMFQAQQMGMQLDQMLAQMSPQGQGAGLGQQQAEAQAAQPQGIQGDNGSSPAQPMTQAGSPPPAGGQGPAAGQTLLRGQPNGSVQTLNQTALRY